MKSQTDYLFPTPIHILDLENPSLCLNIANLILKKVPTEFHLSKDSAFTTTDMLFLEDEFNDLTKLISEIGENFSTEILGLEKSSVELNAMWANVRKNHSKHHIHQHPNSFISGVMYLQTPVDTSNPGTIFFVDPRPAKNMFHGFFEKQSSISDRSWWYTPKTGCVIMFPSWLEHGTDEYFSNTNEYRISLSFNFILKKFIRH